MIVIDLDGFKAINDTYGHLAGDSVLGHVSRFLSENVREGDVFAALAVTNSPSSCRALDAASDLRASAISDALNQLIVPWDGRAIQVRGSVGGACYGPNDDVEWSINAPTKTCILRKSTARRSGRPAVNSTLNAAVLYSSAIFASIGI